MRKQCYNDSSVTYVLRANDKITSVPYLRTRFPLNVLTNNKKLKVEQPGFYKLLIENSKEIICLQNEDGSFIYVNPAFSEISGYASADITGSLPYEWLHPDDRPGVVHEVGELLAHWKTHKADNSIRVRYRVRCKNGRYKWLHAHITFIEDECTGAAQLLTNAQDVTFYMALEEELLTLNKLSENSNAIAGIGGWQWDLEPDRLIWSNEVKNIHEVPLDYTPTIDESILFYTAPAKLMKTAAIDKAIRDLEGWDIELPLITAKGNKKWVRTQGVVEAQNGKAVRIYGVLQDITAAHQIQEQIKLNDSRLRLMQFSIDQASLPMLWADPDGTISYINESGAQLFECTREQVVGKKVWSFYPTATAESYGSFWERVKGEKVINVHQSFYNSAGKLIEVEVTASYISYGDQESNIVFFQDVTERIQSERILVESEKRLRYALEGTGGGLWDWNVVSGDVYLSTVWKSMLGFGDTELENSYHTWYGHIHPEDKSKLLQTLQSVQEPSNNSFSFLHRLRCKNGAYRYILSKGIVIQRNALGKPERLIGINSDITEQILTQEKLIETQQRFHHAFFHSGSGMALVAPNGGWMDVNDALSQITGYSRTELLQMRFQDITHPDDLAEDLTGLQKLINGKVHTHTMEKRYTHKQGYTIWVNLNATAVRNKEGEAVFMVSHIQDITSLKTAQQSLERQNLRLTSSAEHLTRKNRQLAEFSQILSHNLRAPVSNINILLQYYRVAETQDDKEELVELLTQSANALSQTLNELSEVIKVQQYKHIQKEELSFEQVFEKVKKMHVPQIADLKASVRCDFSAAPLIDYPSIYLESILMNLLNNALKYSAPERSPVIEARTFWNNGNLMFEIKDNGRGINLDKHSQNIFKLYKTFHKHPDSKGLGLYMTKNQIEAMGGKIFVESKECEGTKFIINFNQYQASNAE